MRNLENIITRRNNEAEAAHQERLAVIRNYEYKIKESLQTYILDNFEKVVDSYIDRNEEFLLLKNSRGTVVWNTHTNDGFNVAIREFPADVKLYEKYSMNDFVKQELYQFIKVQLADKIAEYAENGFFIEVKETGFNEVRERNTTFFNLAITLKVCAMENANVQFLKF